MPIRFTPVHCPDHTSVVPSFGSLRKPKESVLEQQLGLPQLIPQYESLEPSHEYTALLYVDWKVAIIACAPVYVKSEFDPQPTPKKEPRSARIPAMLVPCHGVPIVKIL